MKKIEASIGPYLTELDRAHRQEINAAKPKRARLEEKISALKMQMTALKEIQAMLVEW